MLSGILENMTVREDILKDIKRVVIKIGSSVISNRDKGRSQLECGLSREWVRHYARKIKVIRDKGYDVVLVSSGGNAWNLAGLI